MYIHEDVYKIDWLCITNSDDIIIKFNLIQSHPYATNPIWHGAYCQPKNASSWQYKNDEAVASFILGELLRNELFEIKNLVMARLKWQMLV